MVDETAPSTSKASSSNGENEAAASKGGSNQINNNDFVYVINKKRRNSDQKLAEIRRSNKIARLSKKKDGDEGLPTGNRYEPLSDTGEDSDMEVDDRRPNTNANKYNKQEQSGRQNRPPPIVIHGKPAAGKHVKLLQLLDEGVTERKYRVKYTNNTNIYVDSNEDHEKLMSLMVERGVQFHTYTRKDQKTHAFVLCGLHHEPTIEEISEEMKASYSIKVLQAFKMKNTYSPKYLIVTDANVTMKHIEKIKYLGHTVVTWQRRENRQQISQCHKCQAWGHATSNCYMAFKCLKCAEPHKTAECPKSAEEPAKCANCMGPHPANSTECPVYVGKLEYALRNRKSTSAKKTYTPAPAPKVSAWTRPPTMVTEKNRHQEERPATLSDLRREVQKIEVPPRNPARAAMTSRKNWIFPSSRQ